jgi:hypothetical protein
MSDAGPPPPSQAPSHGPELPDRIELNQGDAILVLDGNVIELFCHDALLTQRIHVNHVRVDAKLNRKGDRMKFRVGTDIGGTLMNPVPFEVPVADQAPIQALFAEAMGLRTVSAQSSTGGLAPE